MTDVTSSHSSITTEAPEPSLCERISERCSRLFENTLFNILAGSIFLMVGIGLSTITFHDAKSGNVVRILMIGPIFTGTGLLLVLRAMVLNVRVRQHGWFHPFFRSRDRRFHFDASTVEEPFLPRWPSLPSLTEARTIVQPPPYSAVDAVPPLPAYSVQDPIKEPSWLKPPSFDDGAGNEPTEEEAQCSRQYSPRQPSPEPDAATSQSADFESRSSSHSPTNELLQQVSRPSDGATPSTAIVCRSEGCSYDSSAAAALVGQEHALTPDIDINQNTLDTNPREDAALSRTARVKVIRRGTRRSCRNHDEINRRIFIGVGTSLSSMSSNTQTRRQRVDRVARSSRRSASNDARLAAAAILLGGRSRRSHPMSGLSASFGGDRPTIFTMLQARADQRRVRRPRSSSRRADEPPTYEESLRVTSPCGETCAASVQEQPSPNSPRYAEAFTCAALERL